MGLWKSKKEREEEDEWNEIEKMAKDILKHNPKEIKSRKKKKTNSKNKRKTNK
jgi:hypothetical protein